MNKFVADFLRNDDKAFERVSVLRVSKGFKPYKSTMALIDLISLAEEVEPRTILGHIVFDKLNRSEGKTRIILPRDVSKRLFIEPRFTANGLYLYGMKFVKIA